MPMSRRIAAAVFAILPSPVAAETLTVCAKGCDYTSINAAIAASSDGDVIQLAAETYFEGAQIDPIGKAITLRGVLGEAGEPASVLDGAGSHLVLHCSRNENAGTTFERLVIRNGRSSAGGAMFIVSASPTVTDCLFIENSGFVCGGVLILSPCSPSFADCAFTNNSADQDAGGMAVLGAMPTLTDCTFTRNSAASQGGGLWSNGLPTLVNCIFTGNTSAVGRGIYTDSNSPILIDCEFMECCQIDPPRSFIDLGGNDYDSWCNDCRGNVDCRNDGVDAGDLGYLLARWGTDDPQSDIDGDGQVRAGDLGLLIAAWGPCN